MPVTAIVGAQYGSEGKGAVVHALRDRFDVAVRTGGPNAGHSFWHKGQVWKMRQLPVPWTNYKCQLVLGAGAVIDPEVLLREEEATGRHAWIDRNATFILPSDRTAEQSSGLVENIGSTGEGVGRARIGKIARMERQRLAGYHEEYRLTDTARMIDEALILDKHVLLEGTQGAGLSLHHGRWPFVTSNDTNAAQLLADAGIAPAHLSHCLLVARTHPIRVGGRSGPLYMEMEWGSIPGSPKPELTTVTGRQRRIGLWDDDLFALAVRLNAPCGVVITFADYLDPTIIGKRHIDDLSPLVQRWVRRLEADHDIPVVMIGTGGERFEMVTARPCKHGDQWS